MKTQNTVQRGIMKIPKNCCSCHYCTGISQMGYRYCKHPNGQKIMLDCPAYNIQTWCPILEHKVNVALRRQQIKEKQDIRDKQFLK